MYQYIILKNPLLLKMQILKLGSLGKNFEPFCSLRFAAFVSAKLSPPRHFSLLDAFLFQTYYCSCVAVLGIIVLLQEPVSAKIYLSDK